MLFSPKHSIRRVVNCRQNRRYTTCFCSRSLILRSGFNSSLWCLFSNTNSGVVTTPSVFSSNFLRTFAHFLEGLKSQITCTRYFISPKSNEFVLRDKISRVSEGSQESRPQNKTYLWISNSPKQVRAISFSSVAKKHHNAMTYSIKLRYPSLFLS